MRVNGTAAQISALVASECEPADAALESLTRFADIVPYVGVALCAWDPLVHRHRAVASIDYPDDVLRYLSDGYFRLDPAYRLMAPGGPQLMRWRDMPAYYDDSYSVQCVFRPAGYREGLTAYLTTADGRYAGAFHVSTDTPRHPTDAAYAAIDWLRPVFAAVCDVLRRPLSLASSVAPSDNAVIVCPTGELTSLPQRAAGPWLAEGSPLVEALRGHSPRVPRLLWEDPGGRWHRVQRLSMGDATVVCEAPVELPHGLTARELDVITLVAAGRSNREIACALVVTPRTVATHIEHLLEKLGCPNRAACAALAVEEGLLRAPWPDPGLERLAAPW